MEGPANNFCCEYHKPRCWIINCPLRATTEQIDHNSQRTVQATANHANSQPISRSSRMSGAYCALGLPMSTANQHGLIPSQGARITTPGMQAQPGAMANIRLDQHEALGQPGVVGATHQIAAPNVFLPLSCHPSNISGVVAIASQSTPTSAISGDGGGQQQSTAAAASANLQQQIFCLNKLGQPNILMNDYSTLSNLQLPGELQSGQLTATSAQSTKGWHQYVTRDIRKFSVFKLVQAIFPDHNSSDVLDRRMDNFVTYAINLEHNMYEMANSSSAYFRLIAEKVCEIRWKLATTNHANSQPISRSSRMSGAYGALGIPMPTANQPGLIPSQGAGSAARITTPGMQAQPGAMANIRLDQRDASGQPGVVGASHQIAAPNVSLPLSCHPSNISGVVAIASQSTPTSAISGDGGGQQQSTAATASANLQQQLFGFNESGQNDNSRLSTLQLPRGLQLTVIPVQSTKEWHQSVPLEERKFLAFKMAQAIFPPLNATYVLDKRIHDLLIYAIKYEGHVFEMANSKSEYARLLAEKIFEFKRVIEEKFIKRKEQRQQLQAQQQQP